MQFVSFSGWGQVLRTVQTFRLETLSSKPQLDSTCNNLQDSREDGVGKHIVTRRRNPFQSHLQGQGLKTSKKEESLNTHQSRFADNINGPKGSDDLLPVSVLLHHLDLSGCVLEKVL